MDVETSSACEARATNRESWFRDNASANGLCVSELDCEIVACCHIEQFPKKAHDLWIPGGLTRPRMNHSLVFAVEPDVVSG